MAYHEFSGLARFSFGKISGMGQAAQVKCFQHFANTRSSAMALNWHSCVRCKVLFSSAAEAQKAHAPLCPRCLAEGVSRALATCCPACKQRLQVPDAHVGKNVRCPKCLNVFLVGQAAKQAPFVEPVKPRAARRPPETAKVVQRTKPPPAA